MTAADDTHDVSTCKERSLPLMTVLWLRFSMWTKKPHAFISLATARRGIVQSERVYNALIWWYPNTFHPVSLEFLLLVFVTCGLYDSRKYTALFFRVCRTLTAVVSFSTERNPSGRLTPRPRVFILMRVSVTVSNSVDGVSFGSWMFAGCFVLHLHICRFCYFVPLPYFCPPFVYQN